MIDRESYIISCSNTVLNFLIKTSTPAQDVNFCQGVHEEASRDQ